MDYVRPLINSSAIIPSTIMKYYTYAYLREDGTPYYIGLGSGNRIFKRNKNCIKPPRDRSRAIYLKQNISLEEAKRHEIYMISVYGRKDLGTGILHNRTNGGDGTWGNIQSAEQIAGGRIVGKRCAAEKIGMFGESKEQRDAWRMMGSMASAKSCAREFVVEEIATGKIIRGTNVTAFCRERGIRQGNFTSMLKGRQSYAYGYRLPSVL